MFRCFQSSVQRSGVRFCSKVAKELPAELKPPKEATYHCSYHQTAKGRIYDTKPFLVKLQKGKQYFWYAYLGLKIERITVLQMESTGSYE